MTMRWVSGIAMLLISLSSGFPETLEEAASMIGKPVSFTAEVKAVSHSPRSGSTYLNFGDSFPRQILSAKIPTDHQRIADDLPLMTGRTVKVAGTVESTPTGPIVVIKDAKQLEVQPLDPGNVLEENGEGAIHNQKVGLAIREMLAKKDYDALETLATRWRDEKARSLDGQWKLPLFFNSLNLSNTASEELFQQRLDVLQSWAEARPHSLLPLIAIGEVLTTYAWAARGSGYANTVPDWAWKRFETRLAKAREKLGSVRERSKEWPEWYSAMQTVALGEQWPSDNYEALFQEAIGVEPEYEQFYFKKAYWLLPRWYGRPGDWEKFALDARRHIQHGDELYARICWYLDGFYKDLFTESEAQWPLVKKGFEEMLAAYPKSKRNLNFFGALAGEAGDRETCGKVLEQIGMDIDTSAWCTWENVGEVQKWVKDPKASKPRIFGGK